MATDWPVWECRVRENWKCDSMKTSEVLNPKEPKSWGMMMSPRSDVDRRIIEVTWLADITWDDVDTWDVCHVLVCFEHLEY
jgi:hypothetical protein